MLPRISLRLKYKLPIFFLLVSIVPLLVVNYVWFQSSKAQVIVISSSQLLDIVDHANSETHSFFSNKLTSLIVHSQTNAVYKSQTDLIKDEFKNFLVQDKDVLVLKLLDKSGKEIIHIDRTKIYPDNELTDQSSSPSFKIPTFVGGDRYISPVYIDEAKKQVIDISVPVVFSKQSLSSLSTSSEGNARLSGEISGVLVETVDLSGLWSALNTFKVGKDGYVFVVDKQENLLNHPRDKFKESIKATPLLENLSKTGSLTVVQTKNEFGNEALVTYLPVDYVGWYIFGQIPLSDVLSEINKVFVFASLLFVLFFISVVLLSLWLSGTLVERIEELKRGTLYVGQGNLDHKINVKSGDELEDLANSYNTMAQSLKEAFKRMREGF